MKKLLIIISLLPYTSFGKIQLGVNAGVSLNKPGAVGGGIGPYVSIKAILDKKYTIVGVGADFAVYSIEEPYEIINSAGHPTRKDLRMNTQLFSPNIFANYKLPLTKGYAYFGGTAGYQFIRFADPVPRNVFTPSYAYREYVVEYRSKHSYMAGLQAGLTVFPINKLGVNAEVGVRSTRVGKDNLSYFPVSLGVRYNL